MTKSKEQEFNLSDKIIPEGYYIKIEDVKEFIWRLKEELLCHDRNVYEKIDINNFIDELLQKINVLAGDKLVK